MEEEPDVYRVWMPDDDCPGLAMSRAFGDFCLKDYGLVCTPEVFCRTVGREDEFVVLATDGVNNLDEFSVFFLQMHSMLSNKCCVCFD